MSVFRAFIALDLSAEIHQHLQQVIQDFQQKLGSSPVRWVPVENIHLTLKFLGDVSISNLDVLTEIVQSVSDSHHVFVISVGGIGGFPNERRPRVVWVGVEAPAELLAVQRNIDMETSRLGYESDKRGFSPHLTLGRVSRNATVRQLRNVSTVLENSKVGFLGVTTVRQVHLYRSDLQPGGAVYTKVYTADLQD